MYKQTKYALVALELNIQIYNDVLLYKLTN